MVFSENFGQILSGHFQTPTLNNQVFRTVKDTGGVDRTMAIITPSGNHWASSGGSQAQIGSGSTPATDQDIDIENAFVNAPESSPVGSQAPSYVLGTGSVNQATQIQPLGGAVSIEEVVQQAPSQDSGGTPRQIQFSRVIINPPVNAIAGQTINLNREVQI